MATATNGSNSDIKTNETANDKENEEDEEDVPSDFFDDFSNQDFMEGLDIVDAWDEEEQLMQMISEEDKLKEERVAKAKEASERLKNKNKHPRIEFKRNNREEQERLKEKERKLQKRIKDLREKLQRRDETKDSGNRRRDPEKTRRDIQKDKKAKEAKIIDQKLRVVETGLVPPGTEMEIDLKEIEKKTEAPKREPHSKRRSRSRSVERRRRSRSRQDAKDLRYPLSPLRPREKMRSRSRNRFNIRGPRPHSRSPRRRYRSPSLEARRRRSKSLERRREERERERERDGERERPPRVISPGVVKGRSRDSISPMSEREHWLRRRRRPSFSPKRSRSPSRRSLRKSDKAEAEKKSFLQEIRDKLNDTGHPRNSPMQMNYMPMQHNVPVPAPHYVPPQIVPPPQYDQNFFIGPDVPPVMNPNPMYMMQNNMQMGMMPPQPVQNNFMPMPVPAPAVQPPANYQQLPKQISPQQQLEKDKEEIAKLFEDKKISLSDFLSITAKPSDARPTNLQNKIKVISRCQEAIKELGGESHLSGRLFIKKSKPIEKIPEGKYPSPLRKIPVVRLNFTTMAKGKKEKSSFSSTLNNLLLSIGVITEPEVVKEAPKIVQPKTPVFKVKTDLMPVKKNAVKNNSAVQLPEKRNPLIGVKYQMKMVQTDPAKCLICEVRASRKFVDSNIQCGERKIMVEMGVQVCEDDLRSPLKSILKNQSLAHLTPAQILGHSEKKEDDRRQRVVPPPPIITPEKRNWNPDMFSRNRRDFGPPQQKPQFFNSSPFGMEVDSPNMGRFQPTNSNPNSRMYFEPREQQFRDDFGYMDNRRFN